MDQTTFLYALLLGIIEGLTEFIPVSSTGHLIILVDLLHFKAPEGKVFEIVIQLGAILAVCILYFKRLWHVATTCFSSKPSLYFVRNIILAFLPAAIIGVIAHDVIKSVLFSPYVVSCSLILGGIAILIIERVKPAPRIFQVEHISVRTSLLIGLFQALAMIPGVSRSGATIMGSLLLGAERKLAAEFSFFLAIPTMLGATVYDLYKNADHLDFSDTQIIAAGFIAAFIAALLVVKWVIGFISKHGFAPFAWYRIALGSFMLFWLVSAS